MLSHIILLGPVAELGGEPALQKAGSQEGRLAGEQAVQFSRRCAALWRGRSS